MTSAQAFDNTLQGIRRSLEGWQQIDPSVKIGSLSLPEVQAQIASFLKLNHHLHRDPPGQTPQQ